MSFRIYDARSIESAITYINRSIKKAIMTAARNAFCKKPSKKN